MLEKLGTNIVLQGPPGAGQHAKMCNQIAIAAGMMGVCEALAYADHAGLDPATVLDSISAGAAGSWSLTNLAPRILAGDFEPGFFVKHFIKDMRIALESAARDGARRCPASTSPSSSTRASPTWATRTPARRRCTSCTRTDAAAPTAAPARASGGVPSRP